MKKLCLIFELIFESIIYNYVFFALFMILSVLFANSFTEISLKSYRLIFEDCDHTDSIFEAFDFLCDDYSDTTRIRARTIINDTGYINHFDYVYLNILDNFNRLDSNTSKEEADLINYKQSLESLYSSPQVD